MLYSTFLYLYYFGVKAASLFSPKAKLWIEGRESLCSKLKDKNLQKCIWFHVSSLGEFEQISYLIESIKKQSPKEKILVSFFSPSGYEIKKDFKFADTVVYLPFDFKSNVEHFIDLVQPKLVFWVRYEFWLNILSSLKKRKIPIYLLNGVFSDSISPFYNSILTKSLACFTEIFVISEQSQSNLSKLGFKSEVLFDTRYDRMSQILETPFEDIVIQHFVNHDKVVVCGSTWPADDAVISSTINQSKDIKWILVPHEIHPARIDELQKIYPQSQLYSNYTEINECKILIVDKIGFLSKIYRFADVTYVGGGFGKVVHSLIEPLAYSIPIVVGVNIRKSEEAKEFVAHKLIVSIQNKLEFEAAITRFFSNDNLPDNKRKQRIFENRKGSVEKIMTIVKKNIDL